MIAKLKGLLDSQGEGWAVIDVGGVGYLLFASSRTLGRLPRPGEAVSLLVETHVREDHIHLYGFADAAERDWFRLLLTVQGIGSKVALALLSAFSPDDLARAIAAGDKTMLARAQGVGARLAGRLAQELKDKAAALSFPVSALGGAVLAAGDGPLHDALSALINLGYRRVEAHAALLAVQAELGEGAPTPALLRAALKELGKESGR